jgi:hypothetical protein
MKWKDSTDEGKGSCRICCPGEELEEGDKASGSVLGPLQGITMYFSARPDEL